MSKALGATDQLAVDGGSPVHTTGWPRWPAVSEEEWQQLVGPALKAVYLSRDEGLPNSRARAFCQDFAKWLGVEHAMLTSHGTDAIQAAVSGALDADGLGLAGEVICPNYTFIASAGAPLALQCKVCLVDVDRDTCNLDPAVVEAAIGPHTVGIVAVHLGGQAADTDALMAIAERRGLMLIEDCAQAHGAQNNGRQVGSLGHVGAFSFQSSKNLCSGEGGLVSTRDQEIFHRAYAYTNIGRYLGGERWEHPRIGWNYRSSEYIAALLHCRLGLLDEQTDRRDRNGKYLDERLEAVGGLTPPLRSPWCTRHAYHLYMMQYHPQAFGGRSRAEFIGALRAEGVPAGSGYNKLLSDQDAFLLVGQKYPDRVRVEPCPNTQYILEHSIWLSQNVLLGSQQDMDEIAAAVAKIKAAWTG